MEFPNYCPIPFVVLCLEDPPLLNGSRAKVPRGTGDSEMKIRQSRVTVYVPTHAALRRARNGLSSVLTCQT